MEKIYEAPYFRKYLELSLDIFHKDHQRYDEHKRWNELLELCRNTDVLSLIVLKEKVYPPSWTHRVILKSHKEEVLIAMKIAYGNIIEECILF